VEHAPPFNQADKIRPGKKAAGSDGFHSATRSSPDDKTRKQMLVPLKVLDCSLVLLCLRLGSKRAEIPAFPCFRIFLAGIEPVLAGF
jgi:hypothetical protein